MKHFEESMIELLQNSIRIVIDTNNGLSTATIEGYDFEHDETGLDFYDVLLKPSRNENYHTKITKISDDEYHILTTFTIGDQLTARWLSSDPITDDQLPRSFAKGEIYTVVPDLEYNRIEGQDLKCKIKLRQDINIDRDRLECLTSHIDYRNSYDGSIGIKSLILCQLFEHMEKEIRNSKDNFDEISSILCATKLSNDPSISQNL